MTCWHTTVALTWLIVDTLCFSSYPFSFLSPFPEILFITWTYHIMFHSYFLNAYDSWLCLLFECSFPRRWFQLRPKVLAEKYEVFLNSFYSEDKRLEGRFEQINYKIGRNEVSVLFNQTCLKEKILPPTSCICVSACVSSEQFIELMFA